MGGSGKWEVGYEKWEVGYEKWEVGGEKWELRNLRLLLLFLLRSIWLAGLR